MVRSGLLPGRATLRGADRAGRLSPGPWSPCSPELTTDLIPLTHRVSWQSVRRVSGPTGLPVYARPGTCPAGAVPACWMRSSSGGCVRSATSSAARTSTRKRACGPSWTHSWPGKQQWDRPLQVCDDRGIGSGAGRGSTSRCLPAKPTVLWLV